MSEQYYIRFGGRVQGPFEVGKLHELARKGRFSRAYQVSVDGKDWQRASDFPELIPPPLSEVRMPNIHPDLRVEENSHPEPSGSVIDEHVENTSTSIELVPEALWYYTIGSEDRDPIPFVELQSLASNGELSPHEQVWTSGMEKWVEAGTIRDLFPHQTITAEVIPSEQSGRTLTGADQKGPEYRVEPSPEAQKTAPMAVASLVLGLLGISSPLLLGGIFALLGGILAVLGSILAAVFGHVALKQVKQSHNILGGRGLALTGLILGYIVIICMVVAGIVFTVLEFRGLEVD